MDISLLKRIICLFISLFFCGTSMNGQEYKYEIGGMVGGSYYMGDLNKNTFFKGMNPSIGAIFRYNPSMRWAVKTDLLWGACFREHGWTQQCFPQWANGILQP